MLVFPYVVDGQTRAHELIEPPPLKRHAIGDRASSTQKKVNEGRLPGFVARCELLTDYLFERFLWIAAVLSNVMRGLYVDLILMKFL